MHTVIEEMSECLESSQEDKLGSARGELDKKTKNHVLQVQNYELDYKLNSGRKEGNRTEEMRYESVEAFKKMRRDKRSGYIENQAKYGEEQSQWGSEEVFARGYKEIEEVGESYLLPLFNAPGTNNSLAVSEPSNRDLSVYFTEFQVNTFCHSRKSKARTSIPDEPDEFSLPQTKFFIKESIEKSCTSVRTGSSREKALTSLAKKIEVRIGHEENMANKTALTQILSNIQKKLNLKFQTPSIASNTKTRDRSSSSQRNQKLTPEEIKYLRELITTEEQAAVSRFDEESNPDIESIKDRVTQMFDRLDSHISNFTEMYSELNKRISSSKRHGDAKRPGEQLASTVNSESVHDYSCNTLPSFVGKPSTPNYRCEDSTKNKTESSEKGSFFQKLSISRLNKQLKKDKERGSKQVSKIFSAGTGGNYSVARPRPVSGQTASTVEPRSIIKQLQSSSTKPPLKSNPAFKRPKSLSITTAPMRKIEPKTSKIETAKTTDRSTIKKPKRVSKSALPLSTSSNHNPFSLTRAANPVKKADHQETAEDPFRKRQELEKILELSKKALRDASRSTSKQRSHVTSVKKPSTAIKPSQTQTKTSKEPSTRSQVPCTTKSRASNLSRSPKPSLSASKSLIKPHR